MSPVGYSWMPILDETSIVKADESSLPVALFLPDKYLSSQKNGSDVAPDIKWADSKGQSLFKVNTKLVSTIYSQVSLKSCLF